MAQESAKLWKNDPHLIVLYNHLRIGNNIYTQLIRDKKHVEKLRSHKFNVKWLQEEIKDACRNNDKWLGGRQQLDTLIDIRYELSIYYDSVFADTPIEDQGEKFELHHQEFYAVYKQLLRLFQ